MQDLPSTRIVTSLARTLGLAGLLALPCGCGGDDQAVSAALVQTVATGDLRITVRERAELKAQTDTRVVSKLEGRNTLIHLIPEGSVVQKGDKLAELDASAIVEKRATQAIALARSEATLKQARKNFEVMEKELLAAVRTAASRLEIADIRLAKFLGQARVETAGNLRSAATNSEVVEGLRELVATEGFDKLVGDEKPGELADRLAEFVAAEDAGGLEMGEMANQILTQIDEVGLARADFVLAEDTLSYSENLAEKGYVTRNELARDRINHKRQHSRVTVAWNNLQLLIKFTLHETLIGLEQEVDNAQLGLESVEAANEARRVQQSAELDNAEAEYTLAKEQLDNWIQQIENAVLHAPSAGLVVYGRYDWDEPVYEGMEVRERQDIIILPDIRTMVAQLKVHEAQIDKVGIGQPAAIKIDAFPDRAFAGHVSAVSTLPDPSRRSNEIKVYSVTVVLDLDNSPGQIRPGMNATVEINVGTLRDVINVPLPALERSGDRHFVWKVTPGGPVAAEVKLGGNNLTHVEIVSGLQIGDRIHLIRPAGARLPDAEDPTEPAPTGDGTGSGAAAEAAGNSAVAPSTGG